MKNKFTIILATVFIMAAALGCSRLNPLSDSGDSTSAGSDPVTDTIVGAERIGIPECDAIVDELASQTENPEDWYPVRAFRAWYVDKIREAIRTSVEENKSDPEKLATECRKIQVQLDKYRAEEEAKKQ